ncbi:hypothetical protein F4X73_14490 [Candidatus Poribacteria bacterium]|nr:hypothetical protein [Candidatus Poribacteria bacterium]
MPSIRILTLESDDDAETVRCLAKKLAAFMQLAPIQIYTAGGPQPQLRKVIQNYLKQDDYVIIVIDSDGRMTQHERSQQPNSLKNQSRRIVNDRQFSGKVFLVEAIQELEAWLLIDCIGIFCYYATKRAQFRENCRDKVSADVSLKRFVSNNQKGDTEKIVEAVSGGKGAKEHLIELSEKVLRQLNPNLTQRDIDRKKYHESRAPEVAEHIEINAETLRRNDSLKKLGDVIAQFQ